MFKNILKIIIIYLPGEIGFSLRRLYYKNKFKYLGKNFLINIGVIVEGPSEISIGDNVRIDSYCIISAGKIKNKKKNFHINSNKKSISIGSLTIGKNVRINARSSIYAYGGVNIMDDCVLSEGCKIFSSTHIPNDLTDTKKIIKINHANNYMDSPSVSSSIIISNNTFLGVETLIMPGTFVGANSFVAPKSFLKNTFKENSFISGSPAKRIGKRFR